MSAAGVDFAGVELGYTEIIHMREHEFAPKPNRKQPRCATCGRGKHALVHQGQPRSMNALGSGNQFAFQNEKKAWGGRLVELMREVRLPAPLGFVRAEGVCCFPNRVRRDQGNYRFMIEKALGDALTEGGWLEDDDWSHYEFGNLRYRYSKGESFTLLRLFPSDEPQVLEVAA